MSDNKVLDSVETIVDNPITMAVAPEVAVPASAVLHGVKAVGHIENGEGGAAIGEVLTAVTTGKTGAVKEVLDNNFAGFVRADQGKTAVADASRAGHIAEHNLEAGHHNAWEKSVAPQTNSGGAGVNGGHHSDVAVHGDGGYEKGILHAGTEVDDHIQDMGNTPAGRPEQSAVSTVNINAERAKAQTNIERGKNWATQINKADNIASIPKQSFAVKYFNTCGKMASQATMGLVKGDNAFVKTAAGAFVAWKAVETIGALLDGKADVMGVVQQGMQLYMMGNPEAMQQYMGPMMAMNMVGGMGGASKS